MPRYLYRYIRLFGYIGSGTPEDPGTDFGMSVWIDAPDEEAALDWGRRVLADYARARHRHDGSGGDIGPGEIEGWIERDEVALGRAEGRYPACKVGEIPTWHAPWRLDNAEPPEGDPGEDAPR
jgi:hypothetical protein